MGDHNSLEIEKFVALGFLFEIKFRSDSLFDGRKTRGTALVANTRTNNILKPDVAPETIALTSK